MGVFSRIICMQSLKIGTVVINTRTVKRKVQIGSAIEYFSGLITIRTPAVITPILYTMSPIMWTIAALIFIFCLSFLDLSS